MISRSLLLAWVLALAGPAAAQPIPERAKKVNMLVTGSGHVVIDEQRYRISPAVQIRDRWNRIVLHGTLRGTYLAHVIFDAHGDLWRAWLVPAPRERAQPVQP